ncbi:hypothetical protein PHISP_07208 [Aspergillus sp. HF37]|nr:hypothetical protein PHISP_07208 [Aspergillus sp. HF37]
MVYNVVSQADLEWASNATVSDVSRSSSPQTRPTNAFQQLPMHTENIGGGNRMNPPSVADDSSMARLGSMMRSMTEASYEMLEEDDDFEAADHSTRSSSLRRAARLDASARSTKSASPDPPLRSPSTDHPVPLSHPTPGLQSLQGAYVGNVERLERSAECLSSSSADIGSEIRKMDQEQKRRWGSSSSSSIAAGESEFPSAEPAPLVNRMDTEPRYEFPDRAPFAPTLPHPQMSAYDQRGLNPQGQCDPIMSGNKIERPSTTASNDTYQQAKKLFTDFDGVHFVSSDNGQESFRNISLTSPPLATGSESHKQPQTGENMVYYPAPVPMILNLPPRLSRRPAAEREKRRTQALASVPLEDRKSAAWLSGHDQGGKDRRSKPAAGLPPQLRASVFFEPPAASIDIGRSRAPVTATLESILDASAHAPATAFTDHPFAGHIGSEVYGGASHKARSKGLADQRKKQRSRNTLVSNHDTFPAGRRGSSAALGESEVDASGLNGATSLRNDTSRNESRGDDDRSSEDEGTDDSHSRSDRERDDGDEEPDYVGPPNTLLAELQVRKQELKRRRRIAANPVGLHSTLLELDAVAQKQSEHRRQKRITLAWESPDVKQPDDEDNEDVPLAVLYPDKANLPQDARPIGLIEKREMEEGEPLSRRRARLRGEPPVEPPGPKTRASTMHFQHASEPAEADGEDEGETLGQRQKRLKAKNRHSSAAESDFTTEVLAGISHLNEGGEGDDKGQDAAQEDETLAQRRARLQEAAKSQSGVDPKAHNHRKSMAALSQVHRAPGSRQPSYGPVPHRNSMDPRLFKNRMPMQASSQHGPVHPAGYPPCPDYAPTKPYGYAPNHPNTFYSDAILGVNHLAYTVSSSCPKAPKPATEPAQREMINRWRQSVK